ncbi:MAG: hypothetical protein AVDCRST_MAG41-3538 [uncultured Corynebacteriales bacterium]|uniref:Uncharacterized protein n=1 Tax=uncultured Mycobacteriales bacterium TaxID=581187 RepID=A0A6J4JJD2_9ACTN|nr:MAG: hypothetical protein AVDCRST_MAG41-3538 [uncultured Corynebacteriales bacterium]
MRRWSRAPISRLVSPLAAGSAICRSRAASSRRGPSPGTARVSPVASSSSSPPAAARRVRRSFSSQVREAKSAVPAGPSSRCRRARSHSRVRKWCTAGRWCVQDHQRGEVLLGPAQDAQTGRRPAARARCRPVD